MSYAYDFKRANYLKIERMLKDRGYAEEADRVRREMRRLEQRYPKKPSIFSFLYSLIGYGTRRKNAYIFMAIWFVFTWAWLSCDYNNVIGIKPGVILHRENLKPKKDDLVSKRLGYGFSLAFRYHVPIIPADLTPYLEPKGSVMWTYSVFTTLLNWILWPLMLASLVPMLIPRRE